MSQEQDKEKPVNGEAEVSSTEAAEAAERTDTDAEERAETEQQAAGDEITELREALTAAEEKAEENWNQFLRARAELENMRRRAQKDVQQAKVQATEKVIGELLAVKDSLEMGVVAANEEGADVDKLREGSELTLRMLEQSLGKFEVEAIEPSGEKFDPEKHEAMAAQESAEHEPNTVIHVVQKGYRIGERLLRPAMVIVSRQASGDADNKTDPAS